MQLWCNLFVAASAICFCIIVSTQVQDALGINSDETINIQVVVDAYELEKRYKGRKVSKNPSNPTPIDPSLAFMVAPQPFVVSGQATSSLVIHCYPKDIIRWFGSSESNNLGSAIIVYNISNSAPVLSESQLTLFKDRKLEPADGKDIRNVKYEIESNIGLQATVVKAGTVSNRVYFGLYIRKRTEESNKQVLFGYFSWSPSITVTK